MDGLRNLVAWRLDVELQPKPVDVPITCTTSLADVCLSQGFQASSQLLYAKRNLGSEFLQGALHDVDPVDTQKTRCSLTGVRVCRTATWRLALIKQFLRGAIFRVQTLSHLGSTCILQCSINIHGQCRYWCPPKVMSSKGSDRPSDARMTLPLGRLTSRKACLRAGHLGPPDRVGLTKWLSTKGSREPSSCQTASLALLLFSSKSSNVAVLRG